MVQIEPSGGEGGVDDGGIGPLARGKEGEVLFFDDTYPHEVTNDTDEERAVLLFDFERPMTRRGQWLSRLLMRGLRRTAYFKDALENQKAWEERSRETIPEAPLA